MFQYFSWSTLALWGKVFFLISMSKQATEQWHSTLVRCVGFLTGRCWSAIR